MLTYSEMLNVIEAAGIPWRVPELSDTVYSSVLSIDIERLWPAWVAALPAELRVRDERRRQDEPVYLTHTYDCDNHCEDFVSFVCRAAAITALATKSPRGGTACGSFRYMATGSSGFYGRHRAVCYVNRARNLRFMQAQTGRHFTPTPEEIQSCNGMWFR